MHLASLPLPFSQRRVQGSFMGAEPRKTGRCGIGFNNLLLALSGASWWRLGSSAAQVFSMYLEAQTRRPRFGRRPHTPAVSFRWGGAAVVSKFRSPISKRSSMEKGPGRLPKGSIIERCVEARKKLTLFVFAKA